MIWMCMWLIGTSRYKLENNQWTLSHLEKSLGHWSVYLVNHKNSNLRGIYCLGLGLPRWLSAKLTRQCRRCRYGLDPWVGKIPWRRKWQPAPIFLPGKFHGQRSLVGYSPYVTKSWTRLSAWAHKGTHIALGLLTSFLLLCLYIFSWKLARKLKQTFWMSDIHLKKKERE